MFVNTLDSTSEAEHCLLCLTAESHRKTFCLSTGSLKSLAQTMACLSRCRLRLLKHDRVKAKCSPVRIYNYIHLYNDMTMICTSINLSLSVCLSVYLSVYLSICVYLSVSVSICYLSPSVICLYLLSVSICICLYLSLYLSISLYLYLYPFIHRSIHRSIYPSIDRSIDRPIDRSTYLPISIYSIFPDPFPSHEDYLMMEEEFIQEPKPLQSAESTAN